MSQVLYTIDRHIKVKELIALLQGAVEQDESIANLIVWTEGCDCYAQSNGFLIQQIERDEDYLLITRTENHR